jgi:hypothetical protein
MRNRSLVRALLAAAVLGAPMDAAAQMYEAVGTRAQGMAGAFVAVADDATATWWNPAGLASGAFASVVIEQVRTVDPADGPEAGPATGVRGGAYAVAYPALGLSYYRLRISEIRPALSPTEGGDPGRQDQGAAGTGLRSMAVSEYGATFGQSLGGRLVLASTVKLVRSGVVESFDAGEGSAADRLARAADLDVSVETKTDLDLGVMAQFPHVRVGLSVKHLRQPEFGEGDAAFTLKRQARMGVAVVGAGRGAVNDLIAAVDVDLTRTNTVIGEVRHAAAGGEAWFGGRRVALRGGVSANMVGDLTYAKSVGLTLGSPNTGLYVDGAMTFGSDRSREGWAASVRFAF